MQNPYAWAILSLCTVTSFIFTIYTWIASKQFKELSVSCTTNNLIKLESSNNVKLSIQYNGEVIQELSASVFYIWNSGNQSIDCSDIVLSRPISIINIGNAHIYDVQIMRQSEVSNAFAIAYCTPESVAFNFEYMNKGDGIAVQVLHSGPSTDLELTCKIKNGKAIRDCSPIKRKTKKSKLSVATEVFLAALPTILSLLVGIIVLVVFVAIAPLFSPVIRSTLVIVLTILPFTVTFYLSCMIIDMFRKKYRRTIPDSLKSSK